MVEVAVGEEGVGRIVKAGNEQVNNRRLFVFALLLAAGSGCAALAHELLWTRRLVDLLGAGSASSTRVFGCFFLGLSLGAAWSTRIVPRLRRPFRAVAAAEAGIALLAVPIWLLPSWTAWIWPLLGPDALMGWPGEVVKFTVSVLTVASPAFLMGAVLPFLGSAVLGENRGLSRHGVWLYAVNTLGGVLGLSLVIGFALDFLGASGAMAGAIALNLIVASVAMIIDYRTGPVAVETLDPPSQPRSPEKLNPRRQQVVLARQGGVRRAAMVASFISGLGFLALEVLFLEMVTLRAPLSFHATSAVLITVIMLLAVASLVVPSITPGRIDSRRLLVGAAAVSSVVIAVTPAIFRHFALDPSWETPASSVVDFALGLTGLALFTLGPAVLAAGLVFPAAIAWAGNEGGDEQGRRWGALLAVNGAGAVIGAEVAYRVLMPALGIYSSVGVVAVIYVLLALWLVIQSRRVGGGDIGRASFVGPVVAALVVVGTLAAVGGYQVDNDASPGVLYERSGREGTLRVIDDKRFGRAILVNNRYLLGTSSGRWDEERQTHIPMLLHPGPKTVAHIGSGTGITPGAALRYGQVEKVIALELSAQVREAAARYFTEFNNGITDDKRAKVLVEDGRTYIASTVDAFDVITGDAYLPWGGGVGRLYSVEHFAAVRAALHSGGVFCQWLPMHQLTGEQFELIANTFASVFDDVYLFRNTFYLRSPGLALVGFRDGDLDWETVKARSATVRADGSVLDPVARHHEAMAMLYLGRYQAPAGNVTINTLNNVVLELSAARERVTGNIPGKYMIGLAWQRFVRTSVSRIDDDPLLPPWVLELSRLGAVASDYEAARAGHDDRAEVLRREFRAGVPTVVVNDTIADWARWPGDRTLVRRAYGR